LTRHTTGGVSRLWGQHSNWESASSSFLEFLLKTIICRKH